MHMARLRLAFPLAFLLLINYGTACDPDDAQALLSFKSTLTDGQQVLGSWILGTECCSWKGITCNSAGTVDSLNLSSVANFLTAEKDNASVWPSHIAQLKSLEKLDLSNLNISTSFPYAATSLPKLRWLSLSNCNLVGSIPDSISNLSSTLRHLDISFNFFNKDLTNLSTTICKLENLEALIIEGSLDLVDSIPECLTNLRNLSSLDMSSNGLADEIPSGIAALTKLKFLDLSENDLAGGLENLCNLAGIEFLYLNAAFSTQVGGGTLPDCIGNLSTVKELHLSNCYLIGSIPESIGGLRSLQRLFLDGNLFHTSIPESLGNLTNLETLVLNRDTSSNSIFYGTVPASLGNLLNLRHLEIAGTGTVDGGIPASLGDLIKLETLVLAGLGIKGSIPESLLSESSQLKRLDLSINSLTDIPDSIGRIHGLNSLALFNNSLFGPIPSTISLLGNLTDLDLSSNQLTGPIPSLSGLHDLESLDLSDNQLCGTIPPELGNLTRLTWLDLANNVLWGPIPSILGSLDLLQMFNVAGNNLSGPIPPGLSNFDALSFSHNAGLCNAPLPPC